MSDRDLSAMDEDALRAEVLRYKELASNLLFVAEEALYTNKCDRYDEMSRDLNELTDEWRYLTGWEPPKQEDKKRSYPPMDQWEEEWQ